MLSVEQLSFSYPEHDEMNPVSMCFDLAVNRGEILSLIGPSGSGKSSLLNLIAGFITPDAGTIRVENRDIQHLDPAARPLSMVFQSHNLFPHLDVYTNIALGLNPSLKLSGDQHKSIDNALENLGLQGLRARKPGQLSGGQQQRVAIARALVRKHPILLLDEPFAALGPALKEELIELLKQLVSSQQMSALMVSHQPDDALLASERTAFIHSGRVMALAPTAELLADTERSEIRQYLGST